MCEERLNALAILSIEKEIAKNCNFSKMINEIAKKSHI